jgi:4-aminobutyrate aminotransferase-like enzyme
MAGYVFNREPQVVPHLETQHRRIAGPIPAPGTVSLLAALDEKESRSMHGQLPIVWDRATDYNVFDVAGNKWIDFTSTIFVTNIGHSNPHLVSSLASALNSGLLHSYAYATNIRAEYLSRLLDFAGKPFEKAFLLSAGTEATEAVLKLTRMHGQKSGKRRPGIICIEGNWHGRTMGAQLMSSNEAQKAWIGFKDPNIHHLPFPYPWDVAEGEGAAFLDKSLQALADQGVDLATDIAGFMLETFQGWGAVFYPVDYVQAIAAVCRKHGILLAFDEMQAGFARTGKRFGFEHYDVQPDLIAIGKGMGSGMPLSGVLGRAEIMDLPEVGNMSSTHSASPMTCVAGLATLVEIERCDLVEESARKGALLHSELERMRVRLNGRVRVNLGKGMIAAPIMNELPGKLPAGLFGSKVSELCMQRGVLVVHTGRESIKLGPPLTMPDEAIIEGVAVLSDAMAEVDGVE